MTEHIEAAQLGQAVEAAYQDAVKDWRGEYAKGTRLDDLLAAELHGVQVTVNVLPAGRSYIEVAVNARRRFNSNTYFYKLSRAAGQGRLYSQKV